MDIKDFYSKLAISKKPLLVIGKTRTPVAEYDIFSKRIIINEEIIKKMTEIEIKFILCHELGHYLNFWIAVLFKIVGVILILSVIPLFGLGLIIINNSSFIFGVLFWLFSFMLCRFSFNYVDDYNEYVADKYSIEINNIDSDGFKVMMDELVLKCNSISKRNTRRIKRTFNWLKKKGL